MQSTTTFSQLISLLKQTVDTTNHMQTILDFFQTQQTINQSVVRVFEAQSHIDFAILIALVGLMISNIAISLRLHFHIKKCQNHD